MRPRARIASLEASLELARGRRRELKLRTRTIVVVGPPGAVVPTPAEFDAELARLRAARCPHHEDAACCPECPGGGETDGIGFPHPSLARGRKRLQRCSRCRRMVPPERWLHAPARAFFGCRACGRRIGVVKR